MNNLAHKPIGIFIPYGLHDWIAMIAPFKSICVLPYTALYIDGASKVKLTRL